MKLTRRDALALGLGATAVAMLPMRAVAAADEAIAAFTGGAAVGEGDLSLDAPEIAENGNTVPITIDAPGATAVAIFAAGSQTASTRIRLAGTQDVIAVAQLADGSFVQTAKTVKVTIGGCGG